MWCAHTVDVHYSFVYVNDTRDTNVIVVLFVRSVASDARAASNNSVTTRPPARRSAESEGKAKEQNRKKKPTKKRIVVRPRRFSRFKIQISTNYAN